MIDLKKIKFCYLAVCELPATTAHGVYVTQQMKAFQKIGCTPLVLCWKGKGPAPKGINVIRVGFPWIKNSNIKCFSI